MFFFLRLKQSWRYSLNCIEKYRIIYWKCQSNLVLAGFLRNIFKYDVYFRFMEVQHGNSQQVLKYLINTIIQIIKNLIGV
jgi:hypothetical protein